MAQMIRSTKPKQITDMERRLVVAGMGGAGEGAGWTASLGLVGASCNIWNGWAVGSYGTAQGTVCD